MARNQITANTLQRAAERLRGVEGQWRFTPKQLYYASCAIVEPLNIEVSGSQLGCGAVLLLLSVFAYGNRILFWIVVALGILSLLSGWRSRIRERKRPPGRALVMSYDDFEQQFLQPLHEPIEGLIDVPEWKPKDAGKRSIVICDTRETAAWLDANAETAQLGVVSRLASSFTGKGRALVLHDCSPSACALVVQLGKQGTKVVDAGVRPRDVQTASLQEIDGPPASLPGDLSSILSADEVAWLQHGRRVECAALETAELMELIRATL